jgi:phosphotriesterase-related protein
MPVGDQAGRIQTVLGPIDPSRLGVTLTHEHLLIDIAGVLPPVAEAGARGILNDPVSTETLGYIKHHGASSKDDLRTADISTAVEEVLLYKQYGGESLVDVTSLALGRDPVGLARISRATGVHVVMGAAFYVQPAHPPGMKDRSEHDIFEQIVRDVTEGVDGTNIRSGIIGEVGCTWSLTDNERKVLRAAGRAQHLTGAPITIHPGRNEKSPAEIIEILSEVGADMGHTVMGHIERTIFEREDLERLAESGCYIEWDLFGEERSYYDGPGTAPDVGQMIDMPNDAVRMDQITWLVSQGYGDRILMGHDIGFKHRLVKYGGHGLQYILAQIVPRMRQRGFTEGDIQKILVDNPRDALTFT